MTSEELDRAETAFIHLSADDPVKRASGMATLRDLIREAQIALHSTPGSAKRAQTEEPPK